MPSPDFKPETIAVFKKLCLEKRTSLEYLRQFGSPLEKAVASLILDVGDSTYGLQQK